AGPPSQTDGSSTERDLPAAPSETRPATLTHDELLDYVTALLTNPARSTVMAGRDAAVATWSNEEASPQDRATAAYVGSMAVAIPGDTAQAITWINRAIELRPGFRGYLDLRDGLQRQGTGD